MVRFKRFALGFCVVLGILATVADADAAYPRYLILSTPSARTHQTQGNHPGHGQTVTAGAYAWGWFGARAYTHSVRHRGYYGNTWVWGQ